MTITEIDWADLETAQHPHGTVLKRLFPRSEHDIFLAVQHPAGRRMLVLRVPGTAAETTVRRHGALPTTRGLHLQFAPAPEGARDLQVILTADDWREVFNPLITDMATTAQAAAGPGEALTAAIDRFDHWRQLLQAIADTGLDADTRRGIFGELVVLRDHLLPVLTPVDAVRAWTGPAAANQDFQLPGAAIEVKTGAGRQPQTIMIASERQLDDTGVGRLLLAHLAVDERRGGSGESLNSIIAVVRAAVGDGRGAFDDLLLRAGYLPHHRHLYDEPRYTLRGIRFWHVTGDFPRVVEADLRPGVGDCRYRISTVALDRYLLPAEEVGRTLKGQT